MLMALDIPLPQHILAHGWWLVNGGEKMSKSAGNVVNPMDYMEKYGIDAFRYFLAREMVVGQDANFTHDAFVRRINSDLANDLGNVLNRVHRLVLNNFEGKLPAATSIGDAEKEVIDLANKVIAEIKEGLPQARLSQSIETIMQLVRSINRYLEVKAPWKLAKDPALKDELATVLYVSAEAVRLSLCLLWPVIPGKAEEGLAMIGCKFQSADDLAWGILKGGEAFGEGKPLFPRIEEEVKKPEAQPKPKQNKGHTTPEASDPEGWLTKDSYWNKFLFTDKEFSNQIDKYWKENRAKFYAIIDSVEQNRTRLKAAALHNFEQWKILDKQDSSLFNRSFDSYDDAVDHLKEWLSHRFDWISEQTGK